MKALVEFVGAGPGAEDLITVRGLRALEQADLVVYAGSLVNPAHLKACKANCTCLDSASMNLGEQIEAMSDAALAGKRVVRLHTGDPAMYGAINEQIRGLAQKGVAASIIPGVSSVFAAAAALGCELTSPDVSQSVVLTRTPGRTPMPQGEDAAAFARTGAMLVFFLSTGKVGELMRHLMEQGGLAEDTPAAIVYRASWPDERILRGTVGDIARQAEEAGLGRQALVIVGRALGANGTASRLYDADFSHGYRNRLVSENFDGRCALYAFTDKGLTRAREIAAGLGLPTVLHSTRSSNAEGIVHIPVQDFDSRLAANWAQFDAHIFIGATGIPFRKAAPLLRDKSIDPAVLACPESGSHVIALTSGHFGGTNRLARRIARITGGQAVIGSPADVNSLPAFDEAAAQEHARILNPEAVRALNAALLDGSPIAFCGTRAVFERHFASTGQVAFFENPQDVTCGHAILWDSENTLPEEVLYLDVSSRAFVLGVGCRRGVKPQELRLVAERYLSEFGLNAEKHRQHRHLHREGGRTGYPRIGRGMAGSRGFPQRGGAGCRAGVRFGVRGRVPAVRRIRLQSPSPHCTPRNPPLETSRWHWPVCRIFPSPKADKGKSSWPGSDRALPATSRRMSTRRSGGVTPSPATAITSTSSGTASPESP